MAVGLSWAHVLGDAFSATEFMGALGKVLARKEPPRPNNLTESVPTTQPTPTQSPKLPMEDPLSLKRVGPVEDKWITVNNCKLETFSFHFTPAQLKNLQLKLSSTNATETAPFESLCAVIWKTIAKIRGNGEPKMVTICQKDAKNKEDYGTLSNSQVVSVVEADFSIAKASHGELAAMLKAPAADERRKIEEAMEREQGLADFVLYGANLTFVNLEEASFYEFEYQGQRPVGVNCMIDGVGDGGVVLVLPGPRNGTEEGHDGRIVTVILPEKEVLELKSELQGEWLLE